MPDAPDNPQFDNLVRVIETLQRRIRSDGATIRGSEIRTRTALIDPLLYALGWDAANPALVVPDYSAGDGSADYALRKMERGAKPPAIAFIEAERLGENLRPRRRLSVSLGEFGHTPIDSVLMGLVCIKLANSVRARGHP